MCQVTAAASGDPVSREERALQSGEGAEAARQIKYVIDPTEMAHAHPKFQSLVREALDFNEKLFADALAPLLAENARLSAALLWLRNHYDEEAPELKPEVLARIDAVLERHPPNIAAMESLRKDFPRAALASAPGPIEEPHSGDTGAPLGYGQPDTKSREEDAPFEAYEANNIPPGYGRREGK